MNWLKKASRVLTVGALIGMLAMPVFAGDDKVVLVGGGNAYKSLDDFVTNSSVIGAGDPWYVDSNQTTGASGDGKSWGYAVLTIDEAINLATASNGDVIYIAAYHTETISGADGYDVDKAGLRLIGFGSGSASPTLTFSAAGSEVVYGAAGIYTENIRFVAGVTSITMAISIEAAGNDLVFNKCIFPKPTTNSWEFLDTFDIADGADNIRIENCEAYNDEAGAAPAHFIDAGNGTVGPEKLQVINCIIKGDFSVAAIWSDEPCDEAFIFGNTIINHTSGAHSIEFTDAGSGAIVWNHLYGDTEGAILDSGSMYTHGNTYSTAIDLDGIPVWVVDNGLNHLMALDGATQVYPENAVDDSALAKILSMSDPANISDYNNATDSLEALGTNIATMGEASDPVYTHPNYIALSVDLNSATWNTQTAHEILTVTGNIRLRVMVECTETLTDAGDAATLVLGDEITVAGIIASTSAAGAGGANQLDAGEFWIDATPADVSPATFATTVLDFTVLQGADVGYTIGGSAIIDGTLIIHMWWTPLDSTGAAVVGAGGAL